MADTFFTIPENQDQWDRLRFALDKRDKSTLMVITTDGESTEKSVGQRLVASFPQYRFHDFDLSARPSVSLQKAFRDYLPASILQSNPVEYIVNVINIPQNSRMMNALNIEREILFRDFPFVSILWGNAIFIDKLKREARDFWEWIAYHFEFSGNQGIKALRPVVHDFNLTLEFPHVIATVNRVSPEKACQGESDRIRELRAKFEKLKRENSVKPRTAREKLNTLKLLAVEYERLNDNENAIQIWREAFELSHETGASDFEKTDIRQCLEKLLQARQKPIRNPYNNRGMLPHDSDMFFGREPEMNRIENMLSSDNPQCVSIIGERRIGKSSLANRVYHRMLADEKNIAVFMDCGGLADSCNTKDEFFRELNHHFIKFADRFGGHDGNLFEDYTSFKRFIGKEAGNGFRFLIFMDEFEKLAGMVFADNSFFSNLRYMAYRPDFRLAFVTVSYKSLRELTHESIQSSEFWNIFSAETIGLIDEKSVIALRLHGFKQNGFSLGEEEMEKIHHYAGAFPFFNQVACSLVFDARLSGTGMEWNRLEVELGDHYEKLWSKRSKEEKKLLKNPDSGKAGDTLALNQMQTRGILKKIDEWYYPFSGFFSELIENRFRVDMPSLDTVMDSGIKKAEKIGKLAGIYMK